MNKVILIGRLARDPELRTTAGNISVATFTVAVSRPFTPQNGGDSGADFISCVVWRRAAENLAKYCHKGSQIAVEGRIQTRNYTAQDGTKRYVTEVLVDNLTFLGSRSDNQGMAPQDNYGMNSFSGGYDANYGNNNYSAPAPDVASMPTTDISEDPFKDFGEEITLSDDDLPF